jgi:hypothetical protein
MVINKNSKVPILLLIYNDGVITSSRITSISIIKVTTNKGNDVAHVVLVLVPNSMNRKGGS